MALGGEQPNSPMMGRVSLSLTCILYNLGSIGRCEIDPKPAV